MNPSGGFLVVCCPLAFPRARERVVEHEVTFEGAGFVQLGHVLVRSTIRPALWKTPEASHFQKVISHQKPRKRAFMEM